LSDVGLSVDMMLLCLIGRLFYNPLSPFSKGKPVSVDL
jgi:hypothetical protein